MGLRDCPRAWAGWQSHAGARGGTSSVPWVPELGTGTQRQDMPVGSRAVTQPGARAGATGGHRQVAASVVGCEGAWKCPRRTPGGEDTRRRCEVDGDGLHVEEDGDAPGGRLVLRTTRDDDATWRKVVCT